MKKAFLKESAEGNLKFVITDNANIVVEDLEIDKDRI